MNPKTTALLGGQTFAVVHDDGSTGQVTVHQLKLRQWKQAMLLIDDEVALTALICQLTTQQIEGVTPDSYQQLYEAAQSVNQNGFFAFARRQVDRSAEILKNLPPEMLEKLTAPKPNSSMPSPRIPPPAG